MQRKIYDKLLKWKNEENHKPLMVLGARQVGKTYTITEFCQREYANSIIINLLENNQVVELYKKGLNAEEKYIALKALIETNVSIETKDTIVFFDEIQESEELIANLKFLNEKHSNVNIICAGSLLDVKLKRSHISFPVGKVEMLDMYAMSFEEFLMAFNKKTLIDEIKKSYDSNKQLAEPLHEMALNFYRYYLCVGGMPDSVRSLIEVDKDVTQYNVANLENIIRAYFQDMNKYVSNKNESLKIERLYKSVPTQLSNESNKFQYGKIIKDARVRDYEIALDWLIASRLLIVSNKVKVPEIPLKGFVQNDYFKLFLSDVGILRTMLDIKFKDILIDNLSLYKGALTENYVANELISNKVPLYYWHEKAIAEIDFLLYTKDGIIPIEVKASDSVKSKSLTTYVQKFKPKYSIRISTRNFGFVNGIKSVPLYAVFCIKND